MYPSHPLSPPAAPALTMPAAQGGKVIHDRAEEAKTGGSDE